MQEKFCDIHRSYMKYIYIITTILLSYLLISCDERITPKQEANPDLKIKLKLLTDKYWQCNVVEVIEGTDLPKKIFSLNENIGIDSPYINFFCIYNPDSTAYYYTTNGEEALMWVFQNNQAQLKTIDNNGLKLVYDVKKLTFDAMKLSLLYKKSDYLNEVDWKLKLKELELSSNTTQFRVDYTFE
jgi:hypothetical protein